MPFMAEVLLPLPDRDFDVTEVAVPWKLLREAGHRVVFASEEGATPACDPRLLERGVIFGQLGAAPEPIRFYRELEADAAFQRPIRWRDIDPSCFAGLVLAGGHAPGMRQYLGSTALQAKIAAFWALGRPVAAICHGVLVLARADLLAGRRTTCLPRYMERSAYFLTAWKLGKYYRTYPAYVEDEVRAAGPLFERGPRVLSARGTRDDDTPAFVVEDGNYVSGRWPGDSYLLAKKLIERLPAVGAP
jgi:putative intracellular protease/amidase